MISEINGKNIKLTVDAEKLEYHFILPGGAEWIMNSEPYFEMSDSKMLYFKDAAKEIRRKDTATDKGVEAVYSFENGIKAYTYVSIDNTADDIYFSIRVDGDEPGSIYQMAFPGAMQFDAEEGHGYSVFPRMHGTLVPAGKDIPFGGGPIFERDAYMQMFGQVKDGTGYLAIYDTPYDARYECHGQNVMPAFIPSLGRISYKRRMLYRFFENCDYNTLAKSFRSYEIKKGTLVTLREKMIKNPKIKELIGAPIITDTIAVHINEKSAYFNKEDPSKNDTCMPFSVFAGKLEALHEKGLKRAYIHLDGWGKHGYDNLHPMAFPPNEQAGGIEGMKDLSERCRKLGYMFGIHDQYRDYYYDSEGFTFDNAIENIDGSHPYCDVWYGGPHSWLCAKLAPKYVKQTYDLFEEAGIVLDGSYLDVFSVVFMDECFNKEHPMTREECRNARADCFRELTSRGIIPSSEETLGCFMDTQVLCHHSPFFTSNLGSSKAEPVGIPIPLFNLVYHDCVVIPWFGLPNTMGGWGVPGNERPYLLAILYGNTVYCPTNADEEKIKAVETACRLYEDVATEELVKHEFVDGNYRRQRTYFSNGTVIEADLDTGEYTVSKV